MKKTVSEEQIERLFQFTREHYVEHYDLQSELVDHLANAIEQRWEETPELPFEDCIKAEFKKFGIFGFMDVVEKRQKALRKKYRKLMWGQVAHTYNLQKAYKKRVKETGKKWVLAEYIFGVASMPAVLSAGIQWVNIYFTQKWMFGTPYILFLLCLGVVLLLILTYVGVFYLPKNAEKYLAETYPEYKLAS